MQLQQESVSLATVVSVVRGQYEQRAQAHGISIRTEIPSETRLRADATALETVLRNLMDNAVNACTAGNGSQVVVEATSGNAHVVFSVRDDGLGFQPSDRRLIMQKFSRVGDELRRSTPGTGLGLYIVRRLVELSGATISASSEGPGNGAMLTVKWPSA